MRCQRLAPAAVAVAGSVAVVIGIHQGLVHVAPGYEGSIVSGWGGPLGHEERLLARVSVVGLVGTVATARWRRLAVVPVAAGGLVLFYALRAVLAYARDPGLYTEVSTYAGEPVRFVLGAEPFLLVAGGVLLVAAGVLGWRAHANGTTDGDPSPTRSSAT
jgi:hypothetical protein